MFVWRRSSPSMPPTGWWISSRSAAGRGRRRGRQALFALASGRLAQQALDDVVSGDAGSRGAGRRRARGRPGGAAASRGGGIVVFDLETTGLCPAEQPSARSAPSGIEGLDARAPSDRRSTWAFPLPPVVTSLTGSRTATSEARLSRSRPCQRFLDFASGAVLVAHNARFDIGFLDREVELVEAAGWPRRSSTPSGSRAACWRGGGAGEPELALALLRDVDAALPPGAARRGGDRRDPPPLIGLAQERGAADGRRPRRLAAPRPRRVYDKRSLGVRSAVLAGRLPLRRRGRADPLRGPGRNLQRLRSYFRAIASDPRWKRRSLRSSGSSGGPRLRARGGARGAAASFARCGRRRTRSSRPTVPLLRGARGRIVVTSTPPARADPEPPPRRARAGAPGR